MHPFDGYAAAKGLRPKHDPDRYPDPAGRAALRHRLEKERRPGGNA